MWDEEMVECGACFIEIPISEAYELGGGEYRCEDCWDENEEYWTLEDEF